jgi:hypothetical protein
MPGSEEITYYWLPCKVCHKLHRGDVVQPEPERVTSLTMLKTGKLECPENPGKFAEYTFSDWKQATEAEVDKLPH